MGDIMTKVKQRSLWQRLRALVFSGVGLAFVVGILFWAGYNMAMDFTNQESFCITCHEMEANVYQEYRNTIHNQNRSGVRATCPDCHVPQETIPKLIRKVKASKELYGKIVGTINTREKFEDHRLRLAQNEWRRMKANDSQECRNCHEFNSFDYSLQSRRSSDQHLEGLNSGMTCIDCHKGIAHSLPRVDQGIGVSTDGGVAPEVFHPARPQ